MKVDYRLVFDPIEGAFWLCHRGERLLLPASLNGEIEAFAGRSEALAEAFRVMNYACAAVDGGEPVYG